MAYDAERKRVVLFGGGTCCKLYGDTWDWDGSAWRKVSGLTSPGVEQGHTMTYDSLRKRLILYTEETRRAPNQLWVSYTKTPASYRAYGLGCGAIFPPVLTADPLSFPLIGRVFKARLSGLPASTAAAVMFLGATKTAIDLSSAGMPGSTRLH